MNYTELNTLTASDSAAEDLFGTGVALSEDGLVLAVGARNKDVGNPGAAQGKMYTYNWVPATKTWAEREIFIASDNKRRFSFQSKANLFNFINFVNWFFLL